MNFQLVFFKQKFHPNNSIMTKLIEKVSFHIFLSMPKATPFIHYFDPKKVVNWKSSVMNNQKSTHTIFSIINFSKFSISMNFISALLKVLKWKSLTFFFIHSYVLCMNGKYEKEKVQRFMTIRITNRFN